MGAPSKECSSSEQRLSSKERSSSKQRSLSKQGAAVKVSVTLPLAAVASRAIEATSLGDIATPTPHALTEAALLKSRNLLAELSKLNLDVDADSTGRGEGRSGSSMMELSGLHGDVGQEQPERPTDIETFDENIDGGSEQVRLMKLASDVWSGITDETASRSDSKASYSSFTSSDYSHAAVQANNASYNVARANDLLGDALRAVLRGDASSSVNDGYDDDDVDRAKAVLVRVLRRIGEVDGREAQEGTACSVAVQQQPTLIQSLLPTPRELPPSTLAPKLAPLTHSPHAACPQKQLATRMLQPSGALAAAMGGSPRISAQCPPVTPALSRRAFVQQAIVQHFPPFQRSVPLVTIQASPPQAVAAATAASAVTSAAVTAAVSSATAAALLSTAANLTECASSHTVTTTTSITTTTNTSVIALTRAASYVELKPRIR